MKNKIIITLLVIVSSLTSIAQVGIGTTSPNASAKLDITSTNKGFLPPRVTLTGTADVATIASPATGLIVYNTATAGTSPSNVTPGIYYYDGSKWQRIINQQPDATIEFDKATPTTASVVFTPNTQASKDYVYVSTIDNSQWTYNGTAYVTYTPTASTAWNLAGGSSDAGSNKTSGIARSGKVGIGSGITSPSNILEVNGTGGTGTGLKLTTGAASGKILTSDISGNASWQTGAAVIYSEIHSSGNSVNYTSANTIACLSVTKADNVKTLYGSTYGWDNTNKRWVAPFSGLYRVTSNFYFNLNSSYTNPRVYAYKNGSEVCSIVSVNMPSGSSDIATSTSAIIQLNQGDYVIWKTTGGAQIYCFDYHSFIRVESVQ